MPKSSDSKSASSWKKLKKSKPKSRRASSSWRARMRRIFKFSRWAALAAVLIGLAYGANYAWKNLCIDDVFAPKRKPLKSVEFKSDGAITAGWLAGILKIPKGSTISDVNIFHIKKILEEVSQIKSVSVERAYPDILRIEIEELKPMAKLVVDVDSRRTLFLVSPGGDVFRPVCYATETLDGLILVEGAKFESGEKMAGAEKLREFLEAARGRFPDEFPKWASVDISQLESITLPLISVTTRGGTKIVFDAAEPKKQFDKLDYILRYSKQKSLNDFERIDLSLKDRADAKLRTAPR